MIGIWMLISCGDKEPPVNQAPSITAIKITPREVTTSSELICTATATDPDGDAIDLSYRWENAAGDVLTAAEVTQLTPETVQPTDTLQCVATASDGAVEVELSTSITVLNTPPVIDAVTIAPSDAFVDTVLDCTFAASDADLEPLTSEILWLKGDEVLASEASLVLDPSLVSASDEIVCRVTVMDGYEGVATVENSISLQNTAPTLASVRLEPVAPTTQDVVTCIPETPFDINGDEVSFRYAWWVDGVARSETSDDISGFQVGQVLSCEVTPTDGLLDGEPQQGSVVVINTEPVIGTIEIQPNSGVQADTELTCLVTATDVDGDTLTTDIVWSTSSTLGSQNPLLLSPTTVSVNEEVTCTATVTDVHGAVVSAATLVTVENTPPVVSSAASIIGTPTSGSTLSCTGAISDLNDGPLTTSVSWTLTDGTSLGAGASLTVDPATTDVGDEIQCTITAMDTDGDSITDTTSIVVDNTAPQIDALSLSTATVYTDGVIEATVALSDVDLDQTLSWSLDWHVISAVTGQDTVVLSGVVSTLDGNYFSKGDQVYAVVTPFDGVLNGAAQTSGLVDVLNTPPTTASLTISPTTPSLNVDDLHCSIQSESSDLDGDVVEYLFEWLDSDGQILQSNQTTSLTDVLSASTLSFPQGVTCRVTPFDGEEYGAVTEGLVDVVYDCNCPQTTTRDFAFTYWPVNFRHANFNLDGYYTVRHFLTGYYGAVIDMSNGSILNLSQISGLGMEAAALADDSWIVSGLGSEVTYAVTVNGVTHNATDFFNAGETGNHGEDNPSMLMDMGRFQQHIEIPEVMYQGNTDLLGSLSIVSSPQHLVMTHRTTASVSYSGSVTIQTMLSGDLWTQAQVTSLDGTRAVEVVDADGVGWVVVAPEVTDSITQASDGTIVIGRTVSSLSAGQEITIPVLLLPADELSTDQIMMYLDPEGTVQVTYAQMNQSDALTTSVQNAVWNWERGAFVVPLGSIQGSGASANSANWSNGTDFNIYNRHQLEIVHANPVPLHVPLFLDGPINTTFNITGGAPLFRSIAKEPTGVPIQVSKNWHLPGYWPNWFHMYSTPTVPTGNHTMELTVAIGKWGETFAASHAQLSLVGWGANQQWDESALGAWGESITYDPDKTLRRAMVDDVRPFLMNANGQYNWTGNVGGADFLKYSQTSRPWRDQQPTQLRSTYTAPGPVMTDVTYSGITADDAISLEAQTHLVRTDDLVRAYYVLHYEFLENVDYARLGLFQIAADNYSDNGFTKYAYGDSTGVLFDGTTPNHNTTGYASDADRGIELTGDHPWVFLYDSNRVGGNLPEDIADVAFVVRDYAAMINGVQVSNPHINITRTNNGGWSQMSFELGVPFDATNTVIQAGSTIDAVVEYLVVPNDIALYYGPSTDMANVDPTFFGTTDIIELLASSNAIDVTVSTGTLVQNQPTIITGVTGATAAQFVMDGGFGYTPITIQGLFSASGWQLQTLENGTWVNVDQSVQGNDYWQTRWDEETSTYALTFSVNTDAQTEFRLVRP